MKSLPVRLQGGHHDRLTEPSQIVFFRGLVEAVSELGYMVHLLYFYNILQHLRGIYD